ncbi:MAG: conserved rane protein of unknown function [Frankiales bacterium]|nr:conserved rane protein of unknown function [Frankiales bacterium]
MTASEPAQPRPEHPEDWPAEPEPTEEQLRERQQRANRATRGGMAGILCLEAFVVLLIPRTIAQTSVGISSGKTIVLVAVAVAMVVTGFLLRRPWGIGLGSALQVVLALTIALVPAIAIVVVIFMAIWGYMLRTRHELVGTPSGWRILIS